MIKHNISLRKLIISFIVLFIIIVSFSFTKVQFYSDNQENESSCLDISSESFSLSYDWNMTWGNPISKTYSAIVNDSLGNLYLAGYRYNFEKPPIQSFGNIDIILEKYDNSGNILWSIIWGSNLLDYCYAITIDSDNNIYLAGAIRDIIAWDYDMYVVKFNSNGEYQWNITWGGNDYDLAYGIALDSNKDIYIVGDTESFGAGDYDLCLVKFNRNGSYQWDRTCGGQSDDYCSGIKIDSSDNIYLTVNSAGDIYLLKYNNLGTLLWERVWDGGSVDNSKGLTLDFYDNIYITGYLDVVGYKKDLCLIKYNNSGYQQWNHTWGGVEDEYGEEIVVDSLNNTYVLGKTSSYGSGSGDMCLLKVNVSGGLKWNLTYGEEKNEAGILLQLDLTEHILTISTSDYAIFWVKYNNLGVQLWNLTKANGGRYMGRKIYIDSLNNIYIAGTSEDNNMESYDCFMIKFNKFGEQLWNVTWGGSGADWCTGLTIDSEENILIGGYTNSFGDTLFDVFLAKFDKYGTLLWNNTWGGDDLDYCYDIITDSSNNIYLTGKTKSFTGSWQAFLIKYNHLGVYQWNQTLAMSYGLGITKDNLDNIYICGSFIMKCNSSGDVQWISSSGNYYDLVVDSDYNVYTVGYTEASNGDDQITTYKYNNLGVREWVVSWHGIYSQIRGRGIDLDSNQNVYIGGWTQFNPYGWGNYLLLVYNNSGNLLLEEEWGTYYDEKCYDIKLDSWGNVYLVGEIYNMYGGGTGCFVKYANDIIHPEIVIHDPTNNQLFSEEALNYIISIITPELNSTWYFLNGGQNYTVTDTSGTINQTAWDACENGTVTLRFFANDTLGHTGSAEVLIQKYTEDPIITFAISNFFLNTTTPEYFHSGLSLWCNVIGHTNITWVYLCENSTGLFINQSMIDLGNEKWFYELDISNLEWGDYLIFTFFASDSIGNIGINNNNSSLFKLKIYDFQKPISTISYIPHSGINIVNESTRFSIIANDNQGSGIFETFYSINNSNWINYTKPFDLSDFNPGTYIISYYSIDNAGNIEEIHSITISLIEEQPPDSPPDEDDDSNQKNRTIHGYNVILFIFGTIFISICFLFKKSKKFV